MNHMMSMADLMAIDVEIPMIDSGHFLEKEFTEFLWILKWYYAKLSIRFIHVTVVYMVI